MPPHQISAKLRWVNVQPCSVWVWPAHALRPAAKPLELWEPLALDRELLAVTDSSVSRAANAPRLEPVGTTHALLRIPERCASAVLVIHDVDFQKLQRGLPPVDEPFKIGPEALSRRFKLVTGPRTSVALVRSLDWHRPGPIDHLLPLPCAELVTQGSELTLSAPATVVIGPAAVSLLPGETVLPNSELEALDPPRSFRLPEVGLSTAVSKELNQFLNPVQFKTLRIAGHDGAVSKATLPDVSFNVLTKLKRSFAFLPVLLEEREPRLMLLYKREDRSVGSLLSDARLNEWLRDLEALLSAAAKSPTAKPVPEPVAAPPASLPGTRRSASLSTSPPSAPPAIALLPEPVQFGAVRTRNPQFAETLTQIAKVAPGELSILMLGESGTGKEHLAQAVHQASARAKGPFVAVNCSSVPEALIESELFGHQKGAFTGTQGHREGAFVSADGGTLLLDEIGDAPSRVQFALLRVLETRTVKPVGADRERPVNVRVIAATSRNVKQLMAEGTLREDLYFRLAELTVQVPPLRERAGDVPLIAGALLDALGCTKPLTPEAMTLLERQRWPGNVRELRNALKRAVLLAGDAPSLDAACFAGLDPLDGSAERIAPPFEFPDFVRGVALHVWKEQSLPSLPIKSQYEQRAIHRAALLYLRTTQHNTSFPPALVTQWLRLFGEKWATSENGRGVKDLLRALGVVSNDAKAREWLGRVAGG